MAKLIVVVALCLVAVASASFSFSHVGTKNAFAPMVASFEAEAMTCPTTTCLASQGDCYTTSSSTNLVCPSGEYMNTTSTSCNCRMASQFLAIGATCYPADVKRMQCGPLAACAAPTGSTDYKCYGRRMIGDVCTATGMECLPPRVCVNNKCAANLGASDTCYNATTFKQLGMCPLTHYCPSVFTSSQTCTAKGVVGDSCAMQGVQPTATLKVCAPYLLCGISSQTDPKCERPVAMTVATGSDMPSFLGAEGCVSGLGNYTSGKCVDYDAELAKWNTAFPSPSTISCTTALDCNLNGVYLAACVCTAKATGSTPYCALTGKPSVMYAPDVAFYSTSGIYETAYNAGCEDATPNTPQQVSDSNYCSSAWSSKFLAAVCPVLNAQSATSYQCYDMTYGVCNGASALQSSVVMTMIVALVAFFTTQ